MRVLWLLKGYGIGGAERMVLELLPHLPGVEFLPVAVFRTPDHLMPAMQAAGLHPIHLGAHSHRDVSWIGRLKRVIRDLEPDLVHLHLPYAGTGGRLAARRFPIPVVYTEHLEPSSYRPVSRLANSLTLGLNDAIIAVADRVRDVILASRQGRRLASRIRTIHNGIDVERVVRDAATPPSLQVQPGTIGTVARLVHHKGLDTLLEALAHRPGPVRQCVIVGVGQERERLRQRATRLGLDNVHFVGSQIEARAIMRQFQIFVLPSRTEGLPLALLEAMALARPVVAAEVGGVRELVEDGVNGLLVPPDDPRALSHAISRLADDPDLARRLGEAARDTVLSGWHARTQADRLLDLYTEVAHR